MESVSPREVLEWAVETYGEGLTLSLSFGGSEGLVLLDMLSRITDQVRIFTLDTGLLFKETQEFREEIMQRYRLPLDIVHPKLTVEAQARQYGDRLYAHDPDLCCHIRRVEPFQRALKGYKAWVTGIRRDQTPQRAGTPIVGWEKRFEVVKIAPLAAWSSEQVEGYVREHELPTNPLLEKGYRSIGCEPCTQPMEERENARAGRWKGFEKIECGLHWVGKDLKRGGENNFAPGHPVAAFKHVLLGEYPRATWCGRTFSWYTVMNSAKRGKDGYYT